MFQKEWKEAEIGSFLREEKKKKKRFGAEDIASDLGFHLYCCLLIAIVNHSLSCILSLLDCFFLCKYFAGGSVKLLQRSAALF